MHHPPVTIQDKQFSIYLPERKILHSVEIVAARISHDYRGKQPLFLSVLNGSFMFASDLMKEMSIPCEISFIRLSSYEEMQSTGKVKEIIGLKEEIKGRHVVVVEDIVDTGHTIAGLLPQLQAKGPASVEVATLLIKPDSLQHNLSIKYPALSIANDFVVGYGLDYNGLGRNLRDIYKVM
ncbi:hypoxanthine phosphoribosyltransferase [Rufibacter glacialis]|uniref:Hypoxanthine phosphoribosyltransferase n=1 Tax=Rufibacter glacialis TaxID=1259555 RepID=A0A5M8QTV5_9BACT|nr:hypoxanthine phosphoribosyltransferase [Rufibacter glacialis]KAA6437622.1 hypoxanthine phosphoribosyltransferase [Rufibacter glacialis]GGK57734.1 hypoxanthine phosphoribosyltransferase [Rufibacter glacialis]